MANYQFNVDPAKVREAAEQLENAMSSLKKSGDEFYKVYQGISDSDWGAQSKDITVNDKLAEFYPGLDVMDKFINDNVRNLNTAALAYETAEQSNIQDTTKYEGNVIK